jgi:hypothetical protein
VFKLDFIFDLKFFDIVSDLLAVLIVEGVLAESQFEVMVELNNIVSHNKILPVLLQELFVALVSKPEISNGREVRLASELGVFLALGGDEPLDMLFNLVVGFVEVADLVELVDDNHVGVAGDVDELA